MGEINWSKEQLEVLNNNRPMIVSAGAGSGKTTIMTEKAYRLLKDGADIKRIAILTFGNAAAGEMKYRLLERLKRGIYEEEEVVAEKLREQLENISFSNITTISAFCINLTKKYFNIAGVSPSFIIADEQETEKMKEKAIQRILSDYLEREDERFLEFSALVSSGRKLDNLSSMIRYLFEFLSLASDKEEVKEKILCLLEFKESPACAYILDYFNEKVENLIKTGKETVKLLSERGLPEYADYIKIYYVDFLSSVEKLKTFDDFKKFLLIPYPQKTLPTVKGADEAVKIRMNKYRGEVKDLFLKETEFYKDFNGNLLREKLSKENLGLLIELTEKFEKEYDRIKEDASKLDFNDVERCALKILKTSGDEVSREFDYIFIDEYQDTNFIQEEIIKGLSQKAVPFMVGDVKQAIYKFRSAEPKIFLSKMRHYKESGEGDCKWLKDNFRSDWRILDFVNEVFSSVMTERFGGIDYKKTAMFNIKEKYPLALDIPSVEVMEIECAKKYEEELKGIYSVKNSAKEENKKIPAEAVYIADKIKTLVKEGSVWDDKLKIMRKLEYRDIAIFFNTRARNNIDTVNALSSLGIPIFSGAFTKEDSSPEIEAVLSVLKVVDNFKNDVPLASAMLSYFGGFDENELLKIRQKGNLNLQFWETVLSYNEHDGIKIKINKFLFLIENLRFKAGYSDVFGLISELIYTTGFDAYVMNLSFGTEKIIVLNTFLQSLYQEKYAVELNEFLYHEENFKKVSSFGAASDGVNVFTVHKSKGLEFPVVFLAGAYQRKADKIHESDLLMDIELGAGIRFFDKEKKIKNATLSYNAILLKKRKEEAEEFLRTFYVALTRAKNYLFVSGLKPERGGALSYMSLLSSAKESNIKLAPYFKISDEIQISIDEKKQETSSVALKHDTELINVLELGFKNDYPYENSTKLAVKYSASHLKESASETEKMRHINLVSAEEGINYHKVLEHLNYDFCTRNDIINSVEKLIAEGVLENEKIDIDILYDCLNSDIIRKAADLPHFKEKQFMLYLPASELDGIIENLPNAEDKILIQGVIDLLIFDGNTAIIVDFKFSKKAPEELKKIYEAQLSAYELAVKKLLGIKKVKKILYLAYQRVIIEL